MQRTISVIARDAGGRLAIVSDRVPVDCDDDGKGCAAIVAARQDAGDQAVLLLLDDDSVFRHWTRPGPVSGAETFGEGAPEAAALADDKAGARDRRRAARKVKGKGNKRR